MLQYNILGKGRGCPIDNKYGFENLDFIQKSNSKRKLMFITPKKNPSKNSSCGLMKKHIIPWIMVGPEL